MKTTFKSEDFEIVGIRKNEMEKLSEKPTTFWREVFYRFVKNKIAIVGAVILFIMILGALFAPYLRPFSYSDQEIMKQNLAPNAVHWFGTDDLGRDMFVRVWYGARISISIGFIAAVLDVCIGVIYGAIAGYKGGRTDNIMMRFADILSTIPYLLVVILIMTVLQKQGMIPMTIALTITGWINMARIVRGETLSIKNNEYVLAARVMGATSGRIIRKHLVPNILGSIIVTMMLTIPSAIFTEAFLSFLGLGIQLPFPSWGTMASEGSKALTVFPWRTFVPAIAICLTIFAFNAVGDGLRDALDSKQRK